MTSSNMPVSAIESYRHKVGTHWSHDHLEIFRKNSDRITGTTNDKFEHACIFPISHDYLELFTRTEHENSCTLMLQVFYLVTRLNCEKEDCAIKSYFVTLTRVYVGAVYVWRTIIFLEISFCVYSHWLTALEYIYIKVYKIKISVEFFQRQRQRFCLQHW